MPCAIVLWLALAADPGVAWYVMAGDVDVGEVVKLEDGAGYAVWLDGVDGGDIVFEVRGLQELLETVRKRLLCYSSSASSSSAMSSSVNPHSAACSIRHFGQNPWETSPCGPGGRSRMTPLQ